MNNTITILVDNDSWILPHARNLERQLISMELDAKLVHSAEEIREGWACFLIGCIHIVKGEYLSRNTHNLVVHESDLPKGRGFAPMAWQILEGASTIPVCLLEATVGEPDAGDIWIKDSIELTGDEFLPVWRRLQGEKTVELCMKFVNDYESLQPKSQFGEPTWYKRRKPDDSKLDLKLTISQQINLLRIVDNERYPAFFMLGEKKIMLNIYDDESVS